MLLASNNMRFNADAIHLKAADCLGGSLLLLLCFHSASHGIFSAFLCLAAHDCTNIIGRKVTTMPKHSKMVSIFTFYRKRHFFCKVFKPTHVLATVRERHNLINEQSYGSSLL